MMRQIKLLFALLLLAFVYSCTPTSDEEGDTAPDYSNQITGTYAFTTYENGNETGSGTAIISKESNNRIRIGLEDGISFIATNLQRVDTNMIMDVPQQEVDHYQMDALYEGTGSISMEGSRYDGVYFGEAGELRIGLEITINGQSDDIMLVLER